MPGKAQERETDARQWEYTTYAPSGEVCPACNKPIASLERCRRGTLREPSQPDKAVYQHVKCPA